MEHVSRLPELAKTSQAAMDRLLLAYRPLILSRVIRILHAARHDDIQAGMEAVMEAVYAYDPHKGAFGALASTVLNRRLLDERRKRASNRETPLSDMTPEQHGALMAQASRQAYDTLEETRTRAQEIRAYEQALAALGILLGDMQRAAPRHAQTRALCREAAMYLYTTQELRVQTLTGRLPIARLKKQFQTGDKVWERHRAYLIGAVVALAGDYPCIRDYVKGGEGA